MLKLDESRFSISELYHENSKYFLSLMQVPGAAGWEQTEGARVFKAYRRRPRISLPEDFSVGQLSVEEAIVQRRSIRQFSGDAITLPELAKLLFFTNGITAAPEHGTETLFLRAAPSAGALYPIEIYPAVLSVAEVPAGIYHYNVRDHVLELLRPGDYRETLRRLCLFQDFILTANALFLMTAIFSRVKGKYGERGYRFCLLDAGHIAENTYLIATAMNLGVVTIGGFLDQEVNSFLGIDGLDEAIVYASAIGKPIAPPAQTLTGR
jgi:SagB-type dehydrogenase family enzyme